MIRVSFHEGRAPRALFPLALLLIAALAAPAWAGDGAVTAFRDKSYDVRFVTASEAWIVGYPGMVLHSVDAGATWSRVDVGTADALFAVDFVDERTGWIVGRSGTILRTTDGGKTWARQKADTTEPLFAVDFLNATVGCAVGNFGTVFWTGDGGATWEKRQVEPMVNASLNAVAVLGPETALVGGDYPSWELDLTANLDPESISNLYRTDDGGKTWSVVKTGSKAILYDVAFEPDETRGFAAGTKGTLLSTADGGRTWSEIQTGETNHLTGLALAPDGPWAVGLDGVIVKSASGAARKASSGIYGWLSSIAFSGGDGKIGIAVGSRGVILRTTDGGRTWK